MDLKRNFQDGQVTLNLMASTFFKLESSLVISELQKAVPIKFSLSHLIKC